MERIRGFRTDRIIAISNDETPVPLKPGPKVILHCIPIEAFAGQVQFDLIALFRKNAALPVVGPVSWNPRLNLDGLITSDFYDGKACGTYTHLYRCGLIEMVSAGVRVFEHNGSQVISLYVLERELLEYLPKCFDVLLGIGMAAPVAVALSLTGVSGLRIYDPNPMAMDKFPVDRDTLILPETVIQEFPESPSRILVPLFDLVWNAFGYPKSKNFDDDLNWVGGG